MSVGSKQFVLEYVEETGSTNTDLLERVKTSGISVVTVRKARKQTSGRGTRGRSWSGNSGCLMFSVAVPIGKNLQSINGVTLGIGTDIVLGLRKVGVPAEIKWPNDILINEKKLAGILVEVAKAPDQTYVLVVGIGFNLRAQNISTAYGHASLSDVLSDDQLKDESYWLSFLSQSIIHCVRSFPDNGLKRVRKVWNTIAAYRNQTVHIFEENQLNYDAYMLGINDKGALLVQTEDGVKTLLTGTVSIRKKNEFID